MSWLQGLAVLGLLFLLWLGSVIFAEQQTGPQWSDGDEFDDTELHRRRRR